MRNVVFLIFGLLIIQTCSSQYAKKIDWSLDLDYISRELPKRHSDFFTIKSIDYFLNEIEKIKLSLSNLNDFDICIKLQQLTANMGDSHTKVNIGQLINRKKILPLHLYWFKNGLFVLHTTPKYADILGNQIISINQITISTVIDSLSTLITRDNQAIIKSSIPKILPLVEVLEYFKFVKEQKIEMGLKDLNGQKKTFLIEPAEMNRKNRKMYLPDSLALCYRNESAFFIDYYQSSDKIYYIQYNKCWSKELELKFKNGKNADNLPSFKNFENRVFGFLESNVIDKIVFDLRFNGGGNSSQGTSFIKKLARYLEKNPEKKIFVVIGRFTFSSAILNAMDFKRLTNAIIVGEATGGKPNHFGEIRSFKLPSSGLRVNYSTKYFKRTDEIVSSLIPDIEIESDFEDFKNGVDPVYEWIREQ